MSTFGRMASFHIRMAIVKKSCEIVLKPAWLRQNLLNLREIAGGQSGSVRDWAMRRARRALVIQRGIAKARPRIMPTPPPIKM